MDQILIGFGMVADPFIIGVIFMGVIIGVLVGALPGLSSPMAIALLIPFTISMTPILLLQCWQRYIVRARLAGQLPQY